MIESQKSYDDLMLMLRGLNEHDKITLHVVNSNDDFHPVVADPIVLFLKVFDGDVYTFSFNHQDSICPISKDRVFKDLDELVCLKWVLDRKSFSETTGIESIRDVNLLLFSATNKLIDPFEFETTAHSFIKRTCRDLHLNKVIPLMKHLEFFTEMCESVERAVNKYYGSEDDSSFYLFNFKVLGILRSLEKNGICVDPVLFREHFNSRVYDGNLVYSQYNIFTATGRPSNRYGGINYAALNKDDGSRKCFVSRFGESGKLMLVDYSAFHPHLICRIVGYEFPKGVDIYKYLAELYFSRKNISEFDVAEAKKITFRQLYGGVEDKYQYIKYFVHLKDFKERSWKNFQEHGFVLTPWFQRKIDNKHLKDANPNKLFNYILQASELESIAPVMMKLNEFMSDKKSKPVLYTYDSLLFDIHQDEIGDVIHHIIDTMSFGGELPIKAYVGDNYHNLKQVNI